MDVSFDKPIMCACGHAGLLRCLPAEGYQNLRQRFTLVGFEGHRFTLGGVPDDLGALLTGIKARCPACGEIGKAVFAAE